MKGLIKRVLVAGCCLALALALCPAPLPVRAQGDVLSASQVAAAVQTWVRYVTADARPDALVERMEPYQIGGETVAYIAHLSGGGFLLAGADPLVLPVYFYSPAGAYDPSVPDYRYMLDEIAGRLQANRQALTADDVQGASMRTLRGEREAYWQELIAGRAPQAAAEPAALLAEPVSLTLPLTSKWHQGSPYNDQLPNLTLGADERVLVGCNATATAQIMYYWQWPAAGTGTGSVPYDYRWRSGWDSQPLATNPGIPGDFANRLAYDAASHTLRMAGYWDDSIYTSAQNVSSSAAYLSALAALWSRMTQATKTASANFGATTYNWSLTRDTHSDPVDAGDIEVAKINAHVAIGVNSGLGLWFTGSYFGNDVAGLKDHFGYDPDALFTNSPPSGAGADIVSMTDEITWGRPAGLGGSNAAGAGHAWVIHGYNKATDPNRQFMMNFGWAGSSDGWYTFDTAPFPLHHDMMSRIAPPTVKFVGSAVAGDGSPANPYRNVEAAVAGAPNGSTLIFKAGSTNTFAGTLTIDRPLTLKGWGVTITR